MPHISHILSLKKNYNERLNYILQTKTTQKYKDAKLSDTHNITYIL